MQQNVATFSTGPLKLQSYGAIQIIYKLLLLLLLLLGLLPLTSRYTTVLMIKVK